jgi:geranylgeranyl diphosphate synthase type II
LSAAPEYLARAAEAVDAFLDAVVPAAEAPPGALHGAMRHLLFPGGKRLRPALALAACEACGRPAERALPVAAAVELIHTYSLVHDDLPCMDDDSERRGRPTVHVAYGEAVAVLAGDALQALAFEVLARGGRDHPAQEALEVVSDLAAVAGSRHLVGGQVDDLAFAADAVEDPAGRVESVHRRKSAALIAASIVNGARFGGAGPERLACLQKFGEEVGTAFQIADDLLDRDGHEPCSLVPVLGVAGAEARAEALLESALARIRDLDDRAGPLRDLAVAAVRRNR